MRTTCGNCGLQIDVLPRSIKNSKSGKCFCSRSCSAAFNNKNRGCHSERTKKKISESLAGRLYKEKTKLYMQSYYDNPKTCPVCNNIISYDKRFRKSCSPECGNILRSKNLSKSLRGKTGGCRIGSGFGKHGWYCGVQCDSTWELAFVIYCLDHGMNIKRNMDFWIYQDENGKERKYYPDFNIDGVLYEIKGRRGELDQIKINAVDKPIVYIQGTSENAIYLDYASKSRNVSKTSLEILYDDSGSGNVYICKRCNTEFTRRPKGNKPPLFCSRRCGLLANHRRGM